MKQKLDHHVWKILKAKELEKRAVLVALSGGLDSVALLRVLSKVHAGSLGAVYVHHGPGSAEQEAYRDRAAAFCADVCARLQVPFRVLRTDKVLISEAQLREERHQLLRAESVRQGAELIALAQHREDLLETRLLRLIRGTGGQGLEAMEVLREHLFRPFLEISKAELRDYLRQENLEHLEDPSNGSSDPLRNWLRREWLKALEERQEGATQALARSLETLAQELGRSKEPDLLSRSLAGPEADPARDGLSRSFFLSLNRTDQKRLLAQYLLSLGKRDFTQNHLEEVCKRLDKPEKVHNFRIAGLEWQINAEQIRVQS